MDGNKSCLSCEIAKGIKQPLGGKILNARYFNAHQDFSYPIPGLIILASERHFYDLDEMSLEESKEYINLLIKIRSAQRTILGISKVYYFYNEDTSHHFHTWMVPRYDWMKQFGRSIESVRPALLHARNQMNTPKNLKEVITSAEKIKSFLS